MAKSRQKFSDFEFSWRYRFYTLRRHLGVDFGKFSGKTNDKIWSYWRKTAEISLNLLKSGKIREIKAKNLRFRIFPWIRVLIHTRRDLGESFQPKVMTKFDGISEKPSKKGIFGQNGHFLTVFGQKWPIFEFFSKIRLEHFFTLPKP